MGFLGDVGKTIFGGTVKNPSAANLDFLRQPVERVNYDFLRDYATQAGGLAGRGKSYLDYLQPTGARLDVQNASLQNTLGNIERDAGQRFGTDIMEKYARGLIGGGAQSDIAANSLAQIATGAGRTASDAYTTLAGQNLDYATGASRDYNQLMAQGAGLQGNLLQAYASGLGSNVDREMQRRIALSGAMTNNPENVRQPGLIENIGIGFNVCFHPDTMIAMADGIDKRIGDVELGDETAGGVVTSVRAAYSADLMNHNGVLVTGSHAVIDDGTWKRVADCQAKPVPGVHKVISLIVEKHRIYAGGMIFDDEEETVFGDSTGRKIVEGHILYLNSVGA